MIQIDDVDIDDRSMVEIDDRQIEGPEVDSIDRKIDNR